MAVNVARSRYRRRRVLDGLLRRIGPPSVVADTAPEHLALLAALRELPTGQRHALALHYLREYGREGDTGVAPGQAWLYGRDDMSVLGADHVQLTSDGQSWVRFPLPD